MAQCDKPFYVKWRPVGRKEWAREEEIFVKNEDLLSIWVALML